MRDRFQRAAGSRAFVVATLVLVAIVVVGASVTIAGARALSADEERIPAGVTIGGLDVGGLSADQAHRAVLASGSRTGEIALRDAARPAFAVDVPIGILAPRPRATRAVEAALAKDSFSRRLMGELGVAPAVDVPIDYAVDRGRVRAVTARVAKTLDERPVQGRVRVGAERITVRAARAGRVVDRAALAGMISRLPERIEVPTEREDPAVTTAEARAAAIEARAIADRPVRVVASGRRAVLRPQDLRRALRVRPADGMLAVELDPAVVRTRVAPAFAPLERRPVSARFRVAGDRVVIEPSRAGRTLDAARIATSITRAPGATRVKARFTSKAPARTTAQARALGIRTKVSEFTTEYPCCQPRVTNIQLAAQEIDGTIIPAGGTFSMNEVVGERTTDRGFVAAPQINAGQLEDAVGGGVSQIATTLFNAAWFAGLRLDSHTPHEFYISRYPPGREATISWGGPELIFTNDWKAAVLIKAVATDTSITFSMYSTPLGRRVETEMGPQGSGAFTQRYSRRVFEGDALKRSDDFSWSYRSAPAT